MATDRTTPQTLADAIGYLERRHDCWGVEMVEVPHNALPALREYVAASEALRERTVYIDSLMVERHAYDAARARLVKELRGTT